MSIATVLTGGLGNGTFSGSPALLVTEGYSIGEVVGLTIPSGSVLRVSPEDSRLGVDSENSVLVVRANDSRLKG